MPPPDRQPPDGHAADGYADDGYADDGSATEATDRRADDGRGLLLRFTVAERWVHHVTAALLLACLVTATMLYLPAVATLVGHREVVKPVHIYCGLLLPVPTLLGLASRAFRRDLGALNRFGPQDGHWLRSGQRRAVVRGRGVIPVGKFNAGQKLNAAFTAGAALVMLGTGAMLTWPGPWPDRWRTGATFVHDWLFLVIAVVTLGHLWEALRDPGALRGMATGRVTRAWAARHHAAWSDAQPAENAAEHPSEKSTRPSEKTERPSEETARASEETAEPAP